MCNSASRREIPGEQQVRKATLISLCLCIVTMGVAPVAHSQQFAGDNQWVAPYGVSTLVATVGEEYSQVYAISSLVPEWEFNAQITRYNDDYVNDEEGYTAASLYVKRRLSENEAGTAGYAFLAGTGQFPEHLEQGEVSNALESWWVMGVATYGFADDRILLDILPGVTLNTEHGEEDETAWGFTYSSRVAIYDVIPQSALVAEVFGTAGEAYADPAYRFGVRWEGKKWIVAATYSNAFNGNGGAGFELGLMYFTEPRLCWGGCKR